MNVDEQLVSAAAGRKLELEQCLASIRSKQSELSEEKRRYMEAKTKEDHARRELEKEQVLLLLEQSAERQASVSSKIEERKRLIKDEQERIKAEIERLTKQLSELSEESDQELNALYANVERIKQQNGRLAMVQRGIQEIEAKESAIEKNIQDIDAKLVATQAEERDTEAKLKEHIVRQKQVIAQMIALFGADGDIPLNKVHNDPTVSVISETSTRDDTVNSDNQASQAPESAEPLSTEVNVDTAKANEAETTEVSTVTEPVQTTTTMDVDNAKQVADATESPEKTPGTPLPATSNGDRDVRETTESLVTPVGTPTLTAAISHVVDPFAYRIGKRDENGKRDADIASVPMPVPLSLSAASTPKTTPQRSRISPLNTDADQPVFAHPDSARTPKSFFETGFSGFSATGTPTRNSASAPMYAASVPLSSFAAMPYADHHQHHHHHGMSMGFVPSPVKDRSGLSILNDSPLFRDLSANSWASRSSSFHGSTGVPASACQNETFYGRSMTYGEHNVVPVHGSSGVISKTILSPLVTNKQRISRKLDEYEDDSKEEENKAFADKNEGDQEEEEDIDEDEDEDSRSNEGDDKDNANRDVNSKNGDVQPPSKRQKRTAQKQEQKQASTSSQRAGIAARTRHCLKEVNANAYLPAVYADGFMRQELHLDKSDHTDEAVLIYLDKHKARGVMHVPVQIVDPDTIATLKKIALSRGFKLKESHVTAVNISIRKQTLKATKHKKELDVKCYFCQSQIAIDDFVGACCAFESDKICPRIVGHFCCVAYMRYACEPVHCKTHSHKLDEV